MRSNMKKYYFLLFWFVFITLVAKSSFATDYNSRWKNAYSMGFGGIGGNSQSFGLQGTWYFNKYIGIKTEFSTYKNSHTGSLLLTSRFIHKGFAFGVFAGPQYGELNLKYRDSHETINYTSKGIFFQIGPFLGYRITNGLFVNLSINRFYGLKTKESLEIGENSGTLISLFGGIYFDGIGTILGAKGDSSILEISPGNLNKDMGKMWENRFICSIGAGTGTPQGHVFAEFGYGLKPQLELSISGGLGSNGPAFASMLRYRINLPIDGIFFFMGSGLSWQTLGEALFQPHHLEDEEEFIIKNAYFFNFEMGIVKRMRNGFTIRFFIGLSSLMKQSTGECVKNCYHTSAGGIEIYTKEQGEFYRTYPYLGVVLGPSF
jgi:hypothetical protein